MNITAESISLSITVIACVFITVGGLIGLARGGKRAAIHIFTAAAAALLAFFVSAPIAAGMNGLISRISKAKMQNAEAPDLSEIPALDELSQKLPVSLAAPMIFTTVFVSALVAFSVIAAIIIWAVKKRTGSSPVDAGKTEAVSRLCGFIFGAVRGLIIIAVLLVPAVGYIGIAADTTVALRENGDLPAMYDDVCEAGENYVIPLSNSGFVGFLSRFGGRQAFTGITSFKINGERILPNEEIPRLACIAADATPLLYEDPQNYGAAQMKSIDKLSAAFADDGLIKNILADVLSGMSRKWRAGEQFLGASKPQLDERAMPVLDKFLEIASEISADELGGEIVTVGELAKMLIENRDILTASTGVDDIGGRLLASGVVEKFCTTVKQSKLFSPLADYSLGIWMKYLGEQLGVSDEGSEKGAVLAAELTEKLNRALAGDSEALSELTDGIKRIADENGFEIDEAALPLIGEFIINYFSGSESVSEEELMRMFSEGAAKN